MKKRNFLVPFTALVASTFSTSEAIANINIPSAPLKATAADQVVPVSNGKLLIQNGDDQLSFILKREASGRLMAWHESHSSHASHSSHSSHSSHQSGY